MNNGLILSLISGLSTIIGSIFIFIKYKRVGELINFFLSFSIGIMIMISLFELMPSSIPIIMNKYSYLGVILIIQTFVLGYLTVFMINKYLDNENSLYRIGIISFITLVMHNIPEGIIVYMSTFTNSKLCFKLVLSIILHNIPEGILISLPLYYSKKSRGYALLMTLISGLSEFVGALLSYMFFGRGISDSLLSFILLFVSGLMISLSLNEILKQIKYNKYMLYGSILSIGVVLLILVI